MTIGTNRPVIVSDTRPDGWDPGTGGGCCLHCESWWFGKARAHCSGCHLTFTSVTAFDSHRSAAGCKPLAETGLYLHESGMWGGPPMTDEQLAARNWNRE